MDKVVVLTASWCGPCKMLKPIIEDIKGDFDDITTVMVDVDSPEGRELAKAHNVRGVPTVLAFEADTVVKSKSGVMTRNEAVEFFGGAL